MRPYTYLAVGLGLALLPAGAAFAQDAAAPARTEASHLAVDPDRGTDAPTSSPFGTGAVTEADLDAIAGREDTAQIAQNQQTAGVSKNSVGDNSVTGDARIADNAFQNMSGLSILNVNTGNNVAINAAMSVNISITPGQ